MVAFLSKHSSGPASGTQPEGPHSCLGTFLHSVSGVYFLTASRLDVQTCNNWSHPVIAGHTW